MTHVRTTMPGRAACAGALALLAMQGCGGGDSGGNDQVPIFEFVFNATTTVNNVTWQVQASFSPAKPTTSTGSFASTSNIDANDGVNDVAYAVTGTWSGCTMNVDVANAATPLAPHYTGRFSGKDTIVLTPVPPSTMPVLTLARSTPEATNFGC